ncbi:mandelate racemase/muconate lactonizing enzyme family protein [Actinopolymorpha singaporensis]
MTPPAVEAIDFFYLSMPRIEDIGDGSQDMLLVRVRAGDHTGWGECEASPLPTIAGLVCPMSHSACKPVAASVLGQRLADPADIARISRDVRANSLDLLQAAHVLSGIEIALWDLLGRRSEVPVHRLLGYPRAYPKTAYASALFGDTPAETEAKAAKVRADGFRAAKFGWGPYGRGDVAADAELVRAARAGLGPDLHLLVDAGTVWGEDVEAATARLPALEECDVTWLEEPFETGALRAYAELARRCRGVRLAGGEGAHHPHLAQHLVDYGGIGFVQIDTGRIGGIGPAREVAAYAVEAGVTFVNHTFTSPLALSASLQPYAGLAEHVLCEFPVEASPLARAATTTPMVPDADGQVCLPDAPGLGLEVSPDALRPYLRDVEITVDGTTLYRTPDLTT